jgi:hypothetical protein
MTRKKKLNRKSLVLKQTQEFEIHAKGNRKTLGRIKKWLDGWDVYAYDNYGNQWGLGSNVRLKRDAVSRIYRWHARKE